MARLWCCQWGVACDDLTEEECAPCKEEGFFCCPDECVSCVKPPERRRAREPKENGRGG